MSVPGSFRRHRVAIASNLALLVAAGRGGRRRDRRPTATASTTRSSTTAASGSPTAATASTAASTSPSPSSTASPSPSRTPSSTSSRTARRCSASTSPAGCLADRPRQGLAARRRDRPAARRRAQVQLAGGTVAVLDPADGPLWAERVDTRRGRARVAALDTESDPVATTAPDAGLAVSQAGEVRRGHRRPTTVVRRFAPLEAGLARTHRRRRSGADLGPRTYVTPSVTGRSRSTPSRAPCRSSAAPTPTCLPAPSCRQPGPDASVGPGRDARRAGRDRPRHRRGHRRRRRRHAARPPPRCASAPAPTAPGPAASAPSPPRATAPSRAGLRPRHRDHRPGLPRQPRRDRPQRPHHGRRVGPRLRPADPPRQLGRLPAQARHETDDKDDNENQDQGDRRPPEAKDDDLGARPGRTTVLHPLDNDTAPAGRLLAIASVQDLKGSDAKVTISPDGQTVQIDLPEGAGPTRFDYTIDDGRSGVSDTATVAGDAALRRRRRPAAAARGLRGPHLAGPGRAAPSTSRCCPTGATRPTATRCRSTRRSRSAATSSGAVARTDLRRPGPLHRAGAQRRRHRATTPSPTASASRSPTSSPSDVQDLKERQAYAGVAEPDVVSGEAGKTVTIRPLANDLPGSDPVNPDGRWSQLAGKVAQVGGARVRTDLVDGTLSFAADQPRTYFLDYDLRYGNAPFDRGRIRVDVKAPDKPPEAPVAMPDSVTLYGQAADAGRRRGQRHRPDRRHPGRPGRGRRPRQRARRRRRRGPLAAHLDPPGPADAQPAAGPLHDQQRQPVGHQGPGRRVVAPGPRRQHPGHRDRPAPWSAPAARSRCRCSTTTSARPATSSTWSPTCPTQRRRRPRRPTARRRRPGADRARRS